MPDISGTDAAAQICKTLPDIKVIIFSGQVKEDELKARAKSAGCVLDIIEKPLPPTGTTLENSHPHEPVDPKRHQPSNVAFQSHLSPARPRQLRTAIELPTFILPKHCICFSITLEKMYRIQAETRCGWFV